MLKPDSVFGTGKRVVAHVAIIVIVLFASVVSQSHAGTYTVSSSGVLLRSGPGISEPAIATTQRGQIVKQIGVEKDGWVHCEMTDGSTGYISARFLKSSNTGVWPVSKKTLQSENKRLRESVGKLAGELKVAQEKLKEAESLLSSAEAKFRGSEDDLAVLQEQLKEALGKSRNLSPEEIRALADKGDPVFFKGVGEALIAPLDGSNIVLRFPVALSAKADQALMPSQNVRYKQEDHVYYVFDSNALSR